MVITVYDSSALPPIIKVALTSWIRVYLVNCHRNFSHRPNISFAFQDSRPDTFSHICTFWTGYGIVMIWRENTVPDWCVMLMIWCCYVPRVQPDRWLCLSTCWTDSNSHWTRRKQQWLMHGKKVLNSLVLKFAWTEGTVAGLIHTSNQVNQLFNESKPKWPH